MVQPRRTGVRSSRPISHYRRLRGRPAKVFSGAKPSRSRIARSCRPQQLSPILDASVLGSVESRLRTSFASFETLWEARVTHGLVSRVHPLGAATCRIIRRSSSRRTAGRRPSSGRPSRSMWRVQRAAVRVVASTVMQLSLDNVLSLQAPKVSGVHFRIIIIVILLLLLILRAISTSAPSFMFYVV